MLVSQPWNQWNMNVFVALSPVPNVSPLLRGIVLHSSLETLATIVNQCLGICWANGNKAGNLGMKSWQIGNNTGELKICIKS